MGKLKLVYKIIYIDNFIKVVWLMGIFFQIWNKKDSKEKGWILLMGNEKKKFLKDLFVMFYEILCLEIVEKIKKFWEVCLSGMILCLFKFV